MMQAGQSTDGGMKPERAQRFLGPKVLGPPAAASRSATAEIEA